MASFLSCRSCMEATSPRIGSMTSRVRPRASLPSSSMPTAMTAPPPVTMRVRNERRSVHRPAAHPEAVGQPVGGTSSASSGPRLSATSMMDSIKGAVGTAMGQYKFSQPYQVYGSTQHAYKLFAKQASYTISDSARKAGKLEKTEDGEEIGVGGGMWHDEFGLLPTFSTWSNITMLHMYLFAVRLRCLAREDFQMWQTQLVDHFFHDAEERMVEQHKLESRAMRQRYLKDLFQTWRGMILAYDEGVAKGDAILASAVWRNIFKGSEDVDVRHLAAIVSWMRRTLQALDKMEDVSLINAPLTAFKSTPSHELSFVDVPAPQVKGLLPPKEGGTVSPTPKAS